MSYADDREYTPGETWLLVAAWLHEHGSISLKEIQKETGCSERSSYRIIGWAERVFRLYRDEDTKRYHLLDWRQSPFEKEKPR